MNFNVFNLPSGTSITYGRNIYIIGISDDGPVNEPVYIKTIDQAINIFGTKGNLVKSWNEAYQVMGSAINIYLVRINGKVATRQMFAINEDNQLRDSMLLKSSYAGSIYNKTEILVYKDYIQLTNPHNGFTYNFTYEKYPTMGQLVQAINESTRQKNTYVWASVYDYHMPSSYMGKFYTRKDSCTSINLRNGADELNISKNELHDRLDIVYNILEGQPIDLLCIADVYFDDVSPMAYYGIQGNQGYAEAYYTANRDYLTLPHESIANRTATFHGQMINFCYKQMNSSIVTHGIMAFNPLQNVEDILESNSYISKAIFATCLQDRFDLLEGEGESKKDHGKFVSLVCGEFEYKDINGIPYYNNAFLGYAAMLTATLTPESMTNKVVPNISRLRYHLEDDEIIKLSKLGVVTFRKSVMKQAIVVCNGVTAQLSDSPYHNVSNMRMIQMTLSFFKVMLDEYIGGNITKLKVTKTIDKAIEALIKSLKVNGIVQDIQYTFNLSSSGFALVNLNILALYAVEYVSVAGQTKL